MNLLPFVMIIVLILGMFSLSQFQQSISLEKEKNAYLAYFIGLRESRNDCEDSVYVNARKTHSKGKSSPTTPSKTTKNDDIKERLFFRERKVGWLEGRLHLSSLLDESQNNASLKTLTLKYLSALYGHKKFFPKDPKPFLESLIKTLKTQETLIPLHEVVFEDPQMQELFYKILRGTHTYDLEKKEGYPPFDHFFTFEKSDHPPMNFHGANKVFLQVALGPSKAEELILEEKKRLIDTPNSLKSPLSKTDLEKILREDFAEKIQWFHFNPGKREKNPEMHVDEKTKITVRIE
ncbi:MAG: hypothetical protein AB7N99_01880 [Simkaniaceae bacterium]